MPDKKAAKKTVKRSAARVGAAEPTAAPTPQAGVTEPTPVPTTPTAPAASNQPGKAGKVNVDVIAGPITVIVPGGQNRVYSYENDGPLYKIRAKNYAEHKGGTIL